MRVRKATFSDLAALQPLYAAARRFMRENGNPGQWGSARPSTMQLFRDIAEGRGHVLLENGRIEAAFSFTCAPDPDYAEIDGAWLNDAPYGVVHRLASSGRVRGAGAACLAWCMERCGNIRIDTHQDNRPMRAMLARQGFTPCGTVYLRGVGERLAFQKSDERGRP
ncbi:GNAT family N-acetyltransferase [Butyricicoccus faecihominis]|uniref:GNAT family N-acetyltransferase n=1 Tax=Butyricicoccus faecihominis TaxID=1712515 RepID=UPI002478A27A|nr:GNAT family N-acetyltransferase [Butyricicoccus faecihominis]MCQ5128615.1 GNAT family N-acetyltransferase [Butyricicoccus faecihominis]